MYVFNSTIGSGVLSFGYITAFVMTIITSVTHLFHTSSTTRIRATLFLIWLAPLLLLINPMGLIRGDYLAHAGQISVLAQQIKDGILFPHTTQTIQLIGDQTSSLSGRVYYIIGSYISIFFGPNIAIRLLVLSVTGIHVVSLWLCFKHYLQKCKSSFLPLSLTAIAYWTTYAMNNLYVRGAIAEFLATNLLASSVALFMLLWIYPKNYHKTTYTIAMVTAVPSLN